MQSRKISRIKRSDGRRRDQLRPVTITRHYLKHPRGAVLMEVGDTRVICTASVQDGVPAFLRGTGRGWVTAEYSMLPGSTHTRKQREQIAGRVDSRGREIQRLIGRSLRSIVRMDLLGERTIVVDCDVIQADGGTRTAAITGGCVALCDAGAWMERKGLVKTNPVRNRIAAVSVGIFRDVPLLDLSYEEDAEADVDMNVVLTSTGKIAELQATAEGSTFGRSDLLKLLALARKGCRKLSEVQARALKNAE